MNTDFKVYKRKIDVYTKGTFQTNRWFYAWSTNSYRTCKDAVAAAQALHPNAKFKAHFAKD